MTCTWADSKEGHWQIYSLQSTDGGRNWSNLTLAAASTKGAWQADLSNIGNTIGLVWTEYATQDGQSKIYYRLWNEDQSDWDEEVLLSDEFSLAANPVLTKSGLVVWEDYRTANAEVFLREINR